MYDILKACSVCLGSVSDLLNASEVDSNNETWCSKLCLSVPEVDWKEFYLICRQCVEQLEVVYSFKKKCIQSDTIRKEQLVKNEELKPKTDGECAIYICGECRQTFLNKIILIEHIKKNHQRTETLSKNEENNTSKKINDANLNHIPVYHGHGVYSIQKTKDGQKMLQNDKSVENNLKSNTKKINKKSVIKKHFNKFPCSHCTKVFPSSKKFIQHAITEHNIDPKTLKPYNCDMCNNKFSNSSNLMQHKMYHEGNRTSICSYCGKGFITKSDLIIHEKKHLNKREYKCEFCPKSFNTHKDLRSHKLVVHTDPLKWNHICNVCSKRFPIKSNLDQHVRRHTGDKRFECHICSKRFIDKVVLQKHILSHSNVRAFKCEVCKKEYKHKHILDVHLTKVHGIGDAKVPVRVKKYFCQLCPKSYFAKNKLTRHMFLHTGERPFSCDKCKKKFTDKSYVKQHMKNVHNIEATTGEDMDNI